MKHNPDFIKRLAMGDETAFEEIKDLPLLARMSIGSAVDEMKRTENIVTVNNGMSVYEQRKSNYVDDEAVRESMQKMMDQQKENRELAKAATEKAIAEQTRQAVERSRAGLTRNDSLGRQ